HRAVEGAGLAHPLGELDADAGQRAGRLQGALALLGDAGVDLLLLALEPLAVRVGGLDGVALRQQLVAGDDGLHLPLLAALALGAEIVAQDDSHAGSPTPTRTAAAPG